MLKKYLSISLSIFMLANCIPANCFAQSADFVVTQESKLIVPRINYGGSDLIQESNRIYNELVELYDAGIRPDNTVFLRDLDNSIGKVEELKRILEEYRVFLINLTNSQETLKEFESGEISTFERLTEKYFAEVPDYTQPAILEDYFKRKGIPIAEIQNSQNIWQYHPTNFKQSLTDIQMHVEVDIQTIENTLIKYHPKGKLNKDPFETIKEICKRNILNIKENGKYIEDIYTGFDKYASKIFSTPESRADFLKYVWNRTMEIMSRNNPGSQEELLKMLALHEADGVESLQRLLKSLQRKAPKPVKNSLLRMINVIATMTEEQFVQYVEHVNKVNRFTPAQRALIEDVSEFVVDKKTKMRLSQLLLQEGTNQIPEKTTARAAAGKVAGAVAKVVTPTVLILGSLWILNSIVNVDGGNNTFAQSVSPAEIKHKIQTGTATPEEQFAYYTMPSSAEYIEEDLLQFASVMFSYAEVATNPAVKRLMSDPVMRINGLPGSKDIGLNNRFDAEMDKALNKIEISDLQLPRT